MPEQQLRKLTSGDIEPLIPMPWVSSVLQKYFRDLHGWIRRLAGRFTAESIQATIGAVAVNRFTKKINRTISTGGTVRVLDAHDWRGRQVFRVSKLDLLTSGSNAGDHTPTVTGPYLLGKDYAGADKVFQDANGLKIYVRASDGYLIAESVTATAGYVHLVTVEYDDATLDLESDFDVTF
jgi:hypothetical protein